MKNIIVNYKVFNTKINDKNILVLSDLHDYSEKRKTELIDDIKGCNPDLILICGDTLQAKKYINGTISHNRLKEFLRNISESSPVVLGLGNHDLYRSTEETLSGYKELEDSRPGKVFPLSNESIVLDDMKITEFHPRHSAFSPSSQDHGMGALKFAEDYVDSDIDLSGERELYNVLLCHNPKFFAQARSITEQLKFDLAPEDCDKLIELSQKMGSYDMVVSGHLHNGYIPLSKTIKNPSKYMDKGYWEMPIEKDAYGDIVHIRPFIFKKTDMCRGTIYIGETDFRVIQLCDGTYYLKNLRIENPIKIPEEKALNIIQTHHLIPIVISGGINKYFNIPFDNGEITQVKLLKR